MDSVPVRALEIGILLNAHWSAKKREVRSRERAKVKWHGDPRRKTAWKIAKLSTQVQHSKEDSFNRRGQKEKIKR